ncbi:MAG: hypothetical protein R6X18_10400, partial [Chloroflexota bacterium]
RTWHQVAAPEALGRLEDGMTLALRFVHAIALVAQPRCRSPGPVGSTRKGVNLDYSLLLPVVLVDQVYAP